MSTLAQFDPFASTDGDVTNKVPPLDALKETEQLNSFLDSPNNKNEISLNDTYETIDDSETLKSEDVTKTRRQRLMSASSVSSKSSRASSRYIANRLDNTEFAPPPELPIEAIKTKYEFHAKYEADYESLPSYEKIRHSGNCFTRFSAMSLITKKWRQSFWILYEASLYFFRSQEDFEEWLLNPYLSQKKRQALIKRSINFDHDNTELYKVDKIRMKSYRKGGMMYHFKVDKFYKRGDVISAALIGAFSSSNEEDIIEVHAIMKEMMQLSPLYSRIVPRRGVYDSSASSDSHSAYSSNYSVVSGYTGARSTFENTPV